MTNIHIQTHTDGISGDQIFNLTGLIHRHLSIARARTKCSEHNSSAPPLAAQQLGDRRIHFIEVVGDLVVPNTAPRNPPAGEEGNDPRLDRVTVAGPLSGSTPLIEQIGLEVAVIDDLDAPADVRLGADAPTAVRFTSGSHSSVLIPATDPVTQEMQRQIVNFLASDGQCLPLRGSCQ